MENESLNIESPFHHKLLQIIGGDNVAEIKVNKKYLDTIVNAIPGGMVIFQFSKDELTYLYVSPKLSEMLGISLSDCHKYSSLSNIDFIADSDKAFFKENIGKSLLSSKDIDANVRIVNKSGKNLWVNIHCSVLAHKDNSTIYCGFINDVTEKAELESKFDDVVTSLACSCMKCKNDSSLTVIGANKVFYNMIGYSEEEFKKEKNNSFASIMLHPFSPDNEELHSENKFIEKEYPIIVKDGSVKYIVDQSVLVMENGEEILYSTFIDITERKVSELIIEERYQEEINYKNAMFGTMVAFSRLNLDTCTVTDWTASKSNRSTIKTGMSTKDALKALGEVFTESTAKFLTNEFRTENLRRKYFSDNKNYTLESFLEYKDGTGMWVSSQVNLRKNPATNNIEAFIYTKNETDSKYLDIAIKEKITRDYDFIACIDSFNNRSVITDSTNKENEYKYICPDYNKEVIRYANTLILEEDRNEIKKLLHLDTVIAELQNKNSYEIIHKEIVEAGIIKYKKYSYSYLDRKRGLILYSQQDITALVERENKHIIDMFEGKNNQDITNMINAYTKKHIELREKLINLSHTNTITGLPNITGFEMLVKPLIKENPQKDYYIIVQDINSFKIFNEIYGRTKGNEFLRFVASKCSEIIKSLGGLSCHLGADDFVYCCSLESEKDIKRLNDKMTDAINSFPLNYNFVVNTGVYKIEDRNATVTSMCNRAQFALTAAKKNITSYELYDGETREDIIELQELINDFPLALREQQFKVYIQPQFNIFNNKIVGAEALVRWEHPEKGLISPGRFIPALEQNGLITALDRYIISEVFRIMRLLKDNLKDAPPAIAVNLSRIDIFNPNLISDLEELSNKYNITPDEIRLEITESVYVSQPKYMIEFVHRLRSKGYSIEMDDFGSGYSSLNVLKDLEIDLLKLDMKFISSVNSDKSQKILKAVVNMARDIGIPVLVEGVETVEQINFLKSINCRYVQGYYFGKPMNINNYINLIVKNNYEQISPK